MARRPRATVRCSSSSATSTNSVTTSAVKNSEIAAAATMAMVIDSSIVMRRASRFEAAFRSDRPAGEDQRGHADEAERRQRLPHFEPHCRGRERRHGDTRRLHGRERPRGVRSGIGHRGRIGRPGRFKRDAGGRCDSGRWGGGRCNGRRCGRFDEKRANARTCQQSETVQEMERRGTGAFGDACGHLIHHFGNIITWYADGLRTNSRGRWRRSVRKVRERPAACAVISMAAIAGRWLRWRIFVKSLISLKKIRKS